MTLDSPGRLLDRFHDVLLSEIRERRPEYLSDSFTVAEIYQHLVPYASHRDRLGVEMNGDYEDVLLRLLAGQGDFLELESKPARERLRKELDSPNPDTSLFREFAAASVRLNRSKLPADDEDEPAAPGGEAPQAEATEPVEEPADVAEPADVDEPDDVVEEADVDEEPTEDLEAADEAPPPDREPGADDVVSPVEGHAEPSPEHPTVAPEVGATDAPAPAPEEPGPDVEEPAAAAAGVSDDDGACSWCREELPRREKLNFCPFCGTDVRLVPCPSCGEALEPRWRFCIACGDEVTLP